MPDDPPPLPGDSRRQADATLLAYHYQLWHTVLAWLQLGSGERLWIEQAEDFDITGSDVATAAQVSHSPRKVTLRDPKVREAIFNCWRLHQQVGGSSFQFRYITRGEATLESGNPFGEETFGLKLWSAAASSLEIAERLLDFLRGERMHFPMGFSEYLEAASPSEATTALFIPLIFELGCGDTCVIQDAVNVQLAAFGELHGIMPAAAIRARDALFQRVATTAGQPQDRWLTTAHLHATLAASATVIVRPGFEVFMQTAEKLEPSLRALTTLVSGSDTFIEAPLPPPPHCVPRAEVVAVLQSKLLSGRIVFAQASTGMGKTTLAKTLAASERDVWRWVSMSGLRGEAVIQRLRALTAQIVRETGTPNIILDDVDVSASAHAELSHAFAVLAISLTQRSGRMLVTTQTLPTARIVEACGGDSDPVFAVPRMDYQEISEMAGMLGCPEGATREGWARLARVRSLGHPQLARAVLLDAKTRKWPPSFPLDQSADESVSHVRTEARRLLSALPDSERELLLRLSLITGRFRRQHALALAAESAALPYPGQAFDPLVGAWIETMSGASFRVSPLLADAAEDVFAGDRLRELHIQIARAFAQGPLSPQEGAQAFEHAWAARHVPALGGLVSSVFEQQREVFDALSSHLIWFVIEGLEVGEALLPDEPHASLLLRMFQARIAAGNVPAAAGRVFRAWRAEIEKNHPLAGRPSARYILAIHALNHGEVPLSAKDTIEYLGMLFDLEASDPSFLAMADEQMAHIPSEIGSELVHESPAGLQAVLSFNRCQNIAWLDEWLTELETSAPSLRDNILNAARLNPWWCSVMVDAAWLDEEQKSTPDWPHCLAILERLSRFGTQRAVPALSFAAVRVATIIRDEYQHDSAVALNEMDAFLATIDMPHPRLLDARATVLFHLEEYAAAVVVWDNVLSTWQPESGHDYYPAFAARTRAIALARMGNFSGAARGFLDARRRISKDDDTPQVAGFLADSAFCWWKAGEYALAFATLNEAAQAADALPSGYGDLLAFRMRRMVSHIVMIIHNRLCGWAIEGQVEPPPGVASDLTAPDTLKELPEGTFDYTWVLLDRLANLFDVDERVPTFAQVKLAQSPAIATHFLLIQTEIERAIRGGNLTDLPALAIRLESEFARGIELTRQGSVSQKKFAPPTSAEWHRSSEASGEKLFSIALVAACASDTVEKVVEAWRADPVILQWGSEFSVWLNRAEQILGLPADEAALRLRAPEGLTATEGLLLAAKVAADGDALPPDSLRSQTQLVLALALGFWRPAIGHTLARLCERAWRRHTERPALLCNPRLNVQAILETCREPRLGIAKAAAIILVASDATDLRMGPEIREQLLKLRDNALPVTEVEGSSLPNPPTRL